jgi:hypothetical protein
MSERKPKNIFMQGAIPASFIGESIAKHATNTKIGGHSIFLGQVRSILRKKVLPLSTQPMKRWLCRNVRDP